MEIIIIVTITDANTGLGNGLMVHCLSGCGVYHGDIDNQWVCALVDSEGEIHVENWIMAV